MARENSAAHRIEPVERRREERVSARVEVRFNQSPEAARCLRAYSQNFSIGGLCLRTDRIYPLGSSLELTLVIEQRTFNVKAVVAWTRRGVVGVRFEDVAAEDQEALRSIVLAFKKNNADR